MAGPLNLSDADIKGFDALDAGRYQAEIFEMKMDAVKNTSGEGKTPAGTPMIKIQFRIIDPRIDNEVLDQDRRAFTTYTIPPEEYDKKKKATMNGMIARFFMALGYTEEEVKSPKFNPEFDDQVGKQCVVVLSKVTKYNTRPEDNEWDNRVTGVKSIDTWAGATTGGLL